MEIKSLCITEDTVEKIERKHHVTEDEVYELFWNDKDPLLIRRSQRVQGTYVALGRTFAGRYLMVALRPLGQGAFKVLTARDMDDRERRIYRE